MEPETVGIERFMTLTMEQREAMCFILNSHRRSVGRNEVTIAMLPFIPLDELREVIPSRWFDVPDVKKIITILSRTKEEINELFEEVTREYYEKPPI